MKIAIAGLGRVGSAIAYTIVLQGLATELWLANRDHAKALGEAADLRHSLAFCARPMQITGCALEDLSDCELIVITASAPMRAAMTDRQELATANIALCKQLIPLLVRHNPQALLLLVANPVDLLTYQATLLSGFPAQRVFGVGTLVDSGRFKVALSRLEQIHPDDLHAYILGEHSANQFPVFSQAVVGCASIADNETHRALFTEIIQAGLDVHHLKGFTNYAIASATCKVISAIVYDEHRTLPLSTFFTEWCGIHHNCFSIPVVVGAEGIVRHLHPQLNAREQQDLQTIAAAIAINLQQVNS